MKRLRLSVSTPAWERGEDGMSAELLKARPKRLRFLIFHTLGRLVHHAQRIVLRLARTAARLAELPEAIRLLPIRV